MMRKTSGFFLGHLGSGKMLPKSGDLQNGRSRAKHQAEMLEGVCREWMAAPKGKVHSELRGNTERLTETINLHGVRLCHEITDCYNQTLLSTVRYINPTDKADLTFGGLYYQDMPWYSTGSACYELAA